MKRIMIIVASLSGLVSYAQSRESAKVGINTTTPQATMEVQVGASNLTGTTNEGIIAPRLSKEGIANIENPVEGTLLYATDNVYAPAVENAIISERVSDITEKGYYFYNGSKWIGWRDPEVYKDYNLSRDRRVFLSWLNTDVTDINMEADPDLKKVKVIGRNSFSDRDITSVVLPDGLEIIRDHAFHHNKLTTITIPNSVTSIGKYAFYVNKLTSVTIPDSVKSIEEGTFSLNPLTAVTIGNGVMSIGESAFYGNQLTTVTIPNSVTSIGKSAFYDNQLTNVTIPNSVTSIDERAFASNQLTTITIGNGVTSIGESAFYGTGEIELLKISAPVPPAMGMGVFNWPIRRIVVPMASVAAYKAANGWSNYANIIVGE